MKKLIKILIISAFILIIVLAAWFLLSQYLAAKNQREIGKLYPLVKQAAKATAADTFRGCSYNKDTAVISINHQDYFTVRDNQVRIIDFMNADTKANYPNLEVDKEFVDVYWLLENCK